MRTGHWLKLLFARGRASSNGKSQSVVARCIKRMYVCICMYVCTYVLCMYVAVYVRSMYRYV